MKFKILLPLLLFVGVITAQNNSFEEDVNYFLELNGTMGQYRKAVPELVSLLKNQYSDAAVPEVVWEEVSLKAMQSLDGLTKDLVVVYKEYFTQEEIMELVQVYKKESVQKFINNVPELTKASDTPSMVWSRNLYNQITDLLHEKGYQMNSSQ